MAILTLTGGAGYFEWEISGLSWAFDTANYVRAGICTGSFTNGTTITPSGIIDDVYAEPVGSTTSTSVGNWLDYSAGTYTFYGFTETPNGAFWSTGSDTVTVNLARPDDWEWYNSIVSGGNINLTADEWNDFVDRINMFRRYKGLSDYSFTSVNSGGKIYASTCNQAWSAINAINGHGTMPSMAVSGGKIYASFFTGLRDALNAV